MKLIGIVSEYNPFHNGHNYHIERSREIVGRDSAVICVMSGDFVQRGEAAVFGKHSRAEAAVRGGADLIFELPLPWALSSAEGFARGAVRLLGELGCVEYLSFGSECGDLNTLNALAVAMSDPELNERTKQELENGVSYAVARQRAMQAEYGSIAQHLQSPNNILAVEYLKAINEQHIKLHPITITRRGSLHDSSEGSASGLRMRLTKKLSISEFVPKDVEKVYEREIDWGRGPVTMDTLEDALLSRFRMLDEDAYNNLPDAKEGLGNRLYNAAHEESTLDGIISAAKTKRYALSRIRRMYMCAALGITAGKPSNLPPYARVLAANDIGREALRIIAEYSRIPILNKPSAINGLNYECREVFELTSRAHDLYVMAYSAKLERRGRSDYRTSPVII